MEAPFRRSRPRLEKSAHRETRGSMRSAQRLCVRRGSNTFSTARGRGRSRSAGSWPQNDTRARRHSASRYCFADGLTGEQGRLQFPDEMPEPGDCQPDLRTSVQIKSNTGITLASSEAVPSAVASFPCIFGSRAGFLKTKDGDERRLSREPAIVKAGCRLAGSGSGGRARARAGLMQHRSRQVYRLRG